MKFVIKISRSVLLIAQVLISTLRAISQSKQGRLRVLRSPDAISYLPRIVDLPRLVLAARDHPRGTRHTGEMVVTVAMHICKLQRRELPIPSLREPDPLLDVSRSYRVSNILGQSVPSEDQVPILGRGQASESDAERDHQLHVPVCSLIYGNRLRRPSKVSRLWCLSTLDVCNNAEVRTDSHESAVIDLWLETVRGNYRNQ
jgi:hypothetical protein